MVARLTSSLAVLIAFAATAFAAPEPPRPDDWCGTHEAGLLDAVAVHQRNLRRIERERAELGPLAAALASAPAAGRQGDVAILEDDGTMVLQPNTFDLQGVGIQFVPQKGKARAPRVPAFRASLIDPLGIGDLGELLPLTDDSSILVKFAKGFKFPFAGKSWTKAFVNSDGNLTFTEGDGVSTSRSLGRFSSMPRIAPLFVDLDPEHAAAHGGVFFKASKNEVVVTWLEVPEFDDPSTAHRPGPNTFQVILKKNGTVIFSYDHITSRDGVVGVAPGSGALTLLDYQSELPTAPLAGAIAERFGTSVELDDLAIAKGFFSQFADVYDHLIVWLDFPFHLGGAFAYEFTLKNEIKGIGENVYDASAAASSKGRLRSFVQMGSVSRYPSNPDAIVLRSNSGIDIVGHEAGHRWLARLGIPGEGGGVSDALLGRQRAHWSFTFNSKASLLEGNQIVRRPDGTFETVADSVGYSDVDRYVMGLVGPNEVEDTFYVADAQGADREKAPETGVIFSGRQVDVTIGDIVAANGPRVPAVGAAPKSFRMAFILVTPPGQGPSADGLAKVETYRARWESFFAEATGGRGAVDTTLVDR